jgi:aryl-alcohol dehydrogenase-like predicted oxidoreductase
VTDAKLDIVEGLAEWGKVHDVPLLTIAISCLLAQPGCGSVIAGAMTPDQVAANAATADWVPSAEQLAEVDAISLGLAG